MKIFMSTVDISDALAHWIREKGYSGGKGFSALPKFTVDRRSGQITAIVEIDIDPA